MHDSHFWKGVRQVVVGRHEVDVVHRDVVAVPRLRQDEAGVEKTGAIEAVLVNLERRLIRSESLEGVYTLSDCRRRSFEIVLSRECRQKQCLAERAL